RITAATGRFWNGLPFPALGGARRGFVGMFLVFRRGILAGLALVAIGWLFLYLGGLRTLVILAAWLGRALRFTSPAAFLLAAALALTLGRSLLLRIGFALRLLVLGIAGLNRALQLVLWRLWFGIVAAFLLRRLLFRRGLALPLRLGLDALGT